MSEKEERIHKVIMEDRKLLRITGVRKVSSFDTKEIVLDTVKGGLVIKGQDLGVQNLNLENSELEIEGQVDILSYLTGRSKESSGRGVWERVFK
ncbi:MAG TPA: sporulation protein YabP [Peptococcaceae bacterium]|nr:sporulation protein YabP [Peptococcaceae bacterium]